MIFERIVVFSSTYYSYSNRQIRAAYDSHRLETYFPNLKELFAFISGKL